MVTPTRTTRPLSEELPTLLAKAELSLRGLAKRIGVNTSYLSRVLNQEDSITISGRRAGEIAVALGLPRDYFPEYREMVALDAIRHDPKLRDAIYERLRKKT